MIVYKPIRRENIWPSSSVFPNQWVVEFFEKRHARMDGGNCRLIGNMPHCPTTSKDGATNRSSVSLSFPPAAAYVESSGKSPWS